MANVLLDFDGVLFQNKRIHEIIKEKSVDYVSRRLRISRQTADTINTHHYRHFGHTTLHLPKGTLRSYNREVFGTLDWDLVHDCITDEDRRRMGTYFHMANLFPYINHYVFSNAPFDYCSKITNAIGYDLSDLVNPNVFTSDIISDKLGADFLKPLPHTYAYVQSFFHGDGDERRLRKKQCPLFFLDDSPINLLPLVHNSMWNTHHINTKKYKHNPIDAAVDADMHYDTQDDTHYYAHDDIHHIYQAILNKLTSK